MCERGTIFVLLPIEICNSICIEEGRERDRVVVLSQTGKLIKTSCREPMSKISRESRDRHRLETG